MTTSNLPNKPVAEGEYITHLRYADDIVVMAETMEDLSAILNDLSRVSKRVGLKMNMEKTKIMSNAHIVPTPLMVGGSMLEVVDEYVYLGPTSRKRSIVESDSAGQRSGSYAESSRSEYRSVSRLFSLETLRYLRSLTSVCCQ